MARLSAIQLCSLPDISENLNTIEQWLRQLVKDEQHIVVLPECCLYFGGKDVEQLSLAERMAKSNELEQKLAVFAQQYQCYLVGGTIPILNADGNKFTNSSCVYTPQGNKIAQYDKIHLFDVNVADGEKHYFESRYTQAGKSTKVVNTGFARLGLSVCYDIRFPELYRQLRLQGADIITVPSAFTRVTGKAHWQVLLQARAIENQVYIIAAAQEGVHANGRETWGHSMIISPWGEILACLETGVGAISVDFSLDEINRVRTSMPVVEHNQFKTELISYE